ncbi:hypothetical protein KWH28_004173 [Salmonella enterica]|nr:hypothetical protein [Salmonella enterica]EHS7688413.1 hypothetical protein [Salmonella enterica]EKE0329964.1 hypothetical protein [Salmonella enterica]EKI2479684.1 hypothetical protein [Salmonella enterica]
MLKVTCIHLDNGEFALYFNGHYLASEDGSGERWCLDDIRERLSRLPGVVMENVERKVPEYDDWNWNDVADSVFPLPDVTARSMTVAAFKRRLSRYPDDALCCGTFWLADDFLSLDDTLDESTIESAMERAQDGHDANIGFNWDSLQSAIDEVKSV